jgi:hypothetical protein
MHNEGRLLTAEFGVGKGRYLTPFAIMGYSKSRMLANPRSAESAWVGHFTRHNLLRPILLKLKKKKEDES